jgi:hypothetical protein
MSMAEAGEECGELVEIQEARALSPGFVGAVPFGISRKYPNWMIFQYLIQPTSVAEEFRQLHSLHSIYASVGREKRPAPVAAAWFTFAINPSGPAMSLQLTLSTGRAEFLPREQRCILSLTGDSSIFIGTNLCRGK